MVTARMLDIAEVSEAVSLPASALRFYEEKGLIRSVGRKGLRRLFDSDVIDRLQFIALGQQAGFSLDEIVAMFAADGNLDIDRGRLEEKAAAIDRDIAKLAALRDGLRHAAACSAPNHLACPTFRRLMRVASKARARGRRTAKRR